MTVALTFSNGKPFRKPVYRNYALVGLSAILTVINLVFLLVDSDRIYDLYEMTYWPENLFDNSTEIELRPLPTIHDDDYGYFRPRL